MSTEKQPIKINGRYYPLWSKFVHRKAEFIGRKLQDLGGPGDDSEVAETIITGITLKPSGDDSAMFSVDGKDWGCASDVQYLGIGRGQEPGWITFYGYGGHTWRIQAPDGGIQERPE